MLVTIFDTETTDLIANSARRADKQPRVIELFALTLQQTGSGPDVIFNEVDVWESLFHPGILIPEKITQITSITNEMVAGKPAFRELVPEIMSYFARAHRVVAHNVSYDCDMIDIELTRTGITMPFQWPEKICTVEQTEWIKGHRMNLTSLHEHLFGEPFAGAHRAEPDVRATAKCYMELVRRDML